MTKDQFIEHYLRENEFEIDSKEALFKRMVILPCDCQYEQCKGWMAVPKNLVTFDLMNRRNNPKARNPQFIRVDESISAILKEKGIYYELLSPSDRLRGSHRTESIQAFIIELKLALLEENDLNEAGIKGVLKKSFARLYQKHDLRDQATLDIESLLSLIELSLFDSEEIAKQSWEAAQQLDHVQQFVNRDFQEEGRQLADLKIALQESGIVLKVGQSWTIKGVSYLIVFSHFDIDFDLVKEPELFKGKNKSFLLSELLPLKVEDFVYTKY